MSKQLRDWLDDRTSYRNLLHPLRRRLLPTGPSWGYSTASCLLWMLLVVVGTGVLMIVTLGGLGIWAIVDFVVILLGSFRDNAATRQEFLSLIE